MPAAGSPGPLAAVVVLGGSDGGLREEGARALVREGYAALALAYFGSVPLPEALVEIPLEYFGKALSWLGAQPEVDAGRIAVVGGSKGGELAMLLGATYPEHVKAVVAYVPSSVAWQSIPADRGAVREGPKSSWTREGKPVSFLPYARPTLWEVPGFFGFLLGRPTALRPLYERALEDRPAVEEAQIRVERTDGPLLLISGAEDRLWPSTRLSEIAVERLKKHGHPHPYEHLVYEEAGHSIGVPGSGSDEGATEIGRIKLGGSRKVNLAASADSWPKVLAFLRRRLGSPE